MRSKSINSKGLFLSWILVVLLVSYNSVQAQKEEKFIGQVRLMNVVEAECTLQDGLYQIRFKDAKKKRFPKYKSFYFPNEDKNFSKLKKKIFDGFDSIPEEAELLDFTVEKVEIQFRKSAGLASFRFAMLQGKKDKRTYSSWFVKGKAEKIFGI